MKLTGRLTAQACVLLPAVYCIQSGAAWASVVTNPGHTTVPPAETMVVKPTVGRVKGGPGGHKSGALAGDAGATSALAKYATLIGPLPPRGVPDLAAKVAAAEARAAAARRADAAPAGKAPDARAATTNLCTGPGSVGVTPGDPTLAVGRDYVFATSNGQVRVYNKSCALQYSTPLSTQLQSTCDLSFDPQAVYNPKRHKFFNSGLCTQGIDTYFVFQFSLGENISSAASWCTYFTYLTDANGNPTPFEDFPKAGSGQFLTIGFDEYVSNQAETGADFRGADAWIMSWPDTSAGCPAFSALGLQFYSNLVDGPGRQLFSPNGVDYADAPARGDLVAEQASQVGATVDHVTVFKVAAGSTGAPVLTRAGSITLGQPCVAPPDAPQPGTGIKLDASDCRLYGVGGGNDPTYGKEVATLALASNGSGHGAPIMVAYDIMDLVGRTTLESGFWADANTALYNPSMSNDTAALSGGGGSNFVIQANKSSASLAPAIVAVSKKGAGVWGTETTVASGSGSYFDFTGCGGSTNRWGDYSAVKSDPSPPSGTTRVFGENMLGVPGSCSGSAPWQTRVFGLNP